MPLIADRVVETSTSTGIGSISLDGPDLDHEAFSDAFATAAEVFYVISQTGTAWEVGLGTLTHGVPDTLSRDSVLSSSNADALVNFGAGTKNVFCAPPGPFLAGLVDLNKGAARPVWAQPGTPWIDDNAAVWLLKVFDGTDDITIVAIDPTANTARFDFDKGADIASAATADIGAATGNYVVVTGTTDITGFGTWKAGAHRWVRFSGILTITHNPTSLILPGGADIVTDAGAVALIISEGAGNVRVPFFQKADGTAVKPAFLQAVTATYVTYSSHTTTTPFDDTIPQNTEGSEIVTATITPLRTDSKLRVSVLTEYMTSGGAVVIGTLFRDSAADAVAVGYDNSQGVNSPHQLNLSHEEVSGSLSATTFKFRIGPSSAATVYVNGTNTARLFGGINKTIMIVEEIAQ